MPPILGPILGGLVACSALGYQWNFYLFAEIGHIAAIQEMYAGATPGSRLAAQLALETRHWEELAGELLTALLRGKPLASVVRVPVLASAAVAFYLGMETLTHLDGDRSRPATLFDQAARLAVIFDRVPRLNRRARRAP